MGVCSVPCICTQVVPVTPHCYDELLRQLKGLSQDLALDMATWHLPCLRASSAVQQTMTSFSMPENGRALGNGQVMYKEDFLEDRN